jgi:phage shock protein PspC (stress-responsive transcriptional regulator)
MVAGVAAGIGRRYGVDPVLIRVALVVAGIFGGAGVAFYLLGWLFLREETDEVSAIESLVNRGHSSVSKAMTVVLCIALIPASGYLFGDFSTLIGAVVLFGGLYLLHHNRADYRPPVGEPVRDTVPPDVTRPVADTMPDTMPNAMPNAMPNDMPEDTAPMPSDDAPTVSDAVPPEAPRTTPPAWDPLGAAPFAWDLPEPQVAPIVMTRPRRRTKVTLGTLGAAIAVAAVLAMVGRYTPWLTAQHIVGITLGVLGIGMVAGSFVRGGRGLIPFAIVLSVVGVGLSHGGVHGFGGFGGGDAHYAPAKVGDVRPGYRTGAGDVTLDLTQLAGQTGVVHTSVNTGAGDIDVIVPAGADVQATCGSRLGDVNCLGQTASGPLDPPVHATQNDTGTPPGLTIILNADAGTGDVKVASHG